MELYKIIPFYYDYKLIDNTIFVSHTKGFVMVAYQIRDNELYINKMFPDLYLFNENMFHKQIEYGIKIAEQLNISNVTCIVKQKGVIVQLLKQKGFVEHKKIGKKIIELKLNFSK